MNKVMVKIWKMTDCGFEEDTLIHYTCPQCNASHTIELSTGDKLEPDGDHEYDTELEEECNVCGATINHSLTYRFFAEVELVVTSKSKEELRREELMAELFEAYNKTRKSKNVELTKLEQVIALLDELTMMEKK